MKMQIYGLDYSYAAELQEFFNGDFSSNPGDVPAPSSFCEARGKIRHSAFIDLNTTLVTAFYRGSATDFWEDSFRLVAVDGTTTDVPDTPENLKYFGGMDSCRSDPGQICPKSRVSFAYDPLNKLIVDAIMGPFMFGEDGMAYQHLEKASTSDLMIYDRGYASYKLFRRHEDAGVSYCVRVPTKQFTRLTGEFLESNDDDRIVEYFPQGYGRSMCLREGLSIHPVKVRLIKVELSTGKTEVLATNVFGEDLNPEKFGELYHLRWGVEEEYKRLKCRIELEAFSGRKTEFVLQDFHADVLRLNLTTLLARQAKIDLKGRGPKKRHLHAPNMSLALTSLPKFLDALFEPDEKSLNSVINNILIYLCRMSEAIRPGRSYPREKKPTRSGYSFQYKRSS